MTANRSRFITALLTTAAVALSSCSGGDPPDCEPGAEACACRSDATCATGLACANNLCVATSVSGVALPSDARGCEFLLTESTGAVTGVTFSGGVRGTFVREAPRTAVSVVRIADSDFAAGDVKLVTTSGATVAVGTSTCVDSASETIDGAKVVLR